MATIRFTSHLVRHRPAPAILAEGATLAEVMGRGLNDDTLYPDRIWCQHHCGIYVSDDGGHTFRESKNVAPASFGFGVAPHPHDRDRAWFVPAQKDEYRVPVGGKLVVTETRDGGHSYVQHDTGLPKADCWDLIYRHAVVADGSGMRVAMGSTTGNLWLSADEGRNWQHLSAHLPPIAALAFAP